MSAYFAFGAGLPSSKTIVPEMVIVSCCAGCTCHLGGCAPVRVRKQLRLLGSPGPRHQLVPPAPGAGRSNVNGLATSHGNLLALTNNNSVRRLGRQASCVLRTGSCSPEPSHFTIPPLQP